MLITFKIDEDLSLAIIGLAGTQINRPETILERMRNETGQTEVQLVRAELIAGTDHILLAGQNAAHAFKQNRAKSRTLSMETLLYASGQGQISRAIELLGVNTDSHDIVLVIFSLSPHDLVEERIELAARNVLGGVRDDSIIDIPKSGLLAEKKERSLREAYNITDTELAAATLPHEDRRDTITRLVVERCVLLAIAG